MICIDLKNSLSVMQWTQLYCNACFSCLAPNAALTPGRREIRDTNPQRHTAATVRAGRSEKINAEFSPSCFQKPLQLCAVDIRGQKILIACLPAGQVGTRMESAQRWFFQNDHGMNSGDRQKVRLAAAHGGLSDLHGAGGRSRTDTFARKGGF